MSVSVAVSRKRRKRRPASAGALALILALIPNSIGFQDLGALLARQPGVAARAHSHVIASPFGTIHAATFSMPRPVGTGIPHPPIYALANFDPWRIAVSIGAQALGDPGGPLRFPTVNRKSKRDSLIARGREPMPPLAALPDVEPVSQVTEKEQLADPAQGRFDPYAKYQFAAPEEGPASAAVVPPKDSDAAPAKPKSEPKSELKSEPKNEPKNEPKSGKGAKRVKSAARVYFGTDPLVDKETEIKPWAPGEAPVVKPPPASGDPDLKMAALDPNAAPDDGKGGETIAKKGEVTGVGKRPFTPAERLALTGDAFEKAEKCLTNAVYFESRGEAVRGQIAVAQVIMNRVFSPFYPNDVCGVVLQRNRRGCQFSYNCDGIPNVVTEPIAWARSKRIAHDMLIGKLWMPEVGKATHYHAYWVHPDWVNEMQKISRLGVHTFYRPLAWGDGADEPTWGDPKLTKKEAAEWEKKWPVSHSREWLRAQGG